MWTNDRMVPWPGSRWRLRTGIIAAGAVAVLGAGAALQGGGLGVARAGEPDGYGRESAPAGGLFTPRIDPVKTRQAAVDYLVSHGVPRGEAGARIDRQAGQVRKAVALRRRAPQGVRSVWISDSGKLVASVVNADGRRAARAAGATPVAAPTPGADLPAIRDELATQTKNNPPPGFNGATFEVDPAQGTVIAHYLFTSKPRVPAVVQQFGDLVTASAEVGGLRANEDVDVAGATMTQSLNEDEERVCTAAWAVDIEPQNGGAPGNGVMTAGHCFDPGNPTDTKWDVDTIAAGDTQATGKSSTFGPAGDYGFLRLERDRGTTTTMNSDVIEKVEEPVVGATACMFGATSRELCGKIVRRGEILLVKHDGANYLLEGQVRLDVCATRGDSGAPVYMDLDPGQAKAPFGIAALGIHSSSTNGQHCQSHFTPLSEVDFEAKYHIRIDGG